MRAVSRHVVASSLLCAALVVGMTGCASPGKGPGDFTVVLLPDTQYYSEQYPETYLAQTRWIASRVKQDNIRFVVHLGDIVDDGRVEKEWQVADHAHRILDGVVPYSVTPGNHDLLGLKGKGKTPVWYFDKYFPASRFAGCAWYGGHMGQTNANNFCFFEGGGAKFMVVSLEFAPTDEVLGWADGVISAHRDRRVIVATHYYLRPEGRGKEARPEGKEGRVGEELWNRLIRRHENVFLVVSGHVSGVNHQTSVNDAGKTVHEILCDYQAYPNGGDGWLAMLRFVPAQHQIRVQAYSPTLNQFNMDPKHTYTLDCGPGAGKVKKAG
jgi:hypothetical protein